ncbi:MAG: GGDEF domain-containing protein [Pseudomonadota bacterium]
MPFREREISLSSWWGEFINPAAEQDFRAHTARAAARDLRIALWSWLALLLILIWFDLGLYGFSAGELVIFSVRAVILMGLLALILYSQHRPMLAASGYAVTLLELICFVSFFLVYFFRVGNPIYTIVITLLMQIAVSVVIPNRLLLATLASTFGTAGTLICAWVLNMRGANAIALFMFLTIASLLGYLAARRQQLMQRRQFALLRKTEEINVRLTAEIERRKLLENELKQQAITDPLTGLYNRRHFETLFERERLRALRNKSALCLCLIDLDFFKRINDLYGHEVGDRVLQQAANLFVTHLRQTDFVGRIGGEEFVLLLPDTTPPDARQLIERLRRILAGESVDADEREITVTATFAIARVEPEKDTLVKALRIADKALYEGKSAGRNRVVMAESC